MTDLLRNTPLARRHIELGAKMVPFAGWNMPVQYPDGILAEHRHTRENVSLFDICHMGEFRVRGPNAAERLDRALARAVADQPVGVCRYNFLLNENGGVLDDVILYRLDKNEFYIVVNAGSRENDREVLRERLAGLDFVDESDSTCKLDLQGPLAGLVLEKLGFPVETLPKYYHWRSASVAGIDCLLSRTGYTGELGFEFYCAAEHAEKLWNILLRIDPVKPAGLGARDTLRLEMGYPLYGHELNPDTTPVEAGFGAMLNLENKRNFVGADALRRRSPAKFLTGLLLEGRRTARSGNVLQKDSEPIGIVTSGTFAPSLECAVALAYSTRILKVGEKCEIDTGRGVLSAKTVKTPFYQNGTVRKI